MYLIRRSILIYSDCQCTPGEEQNFFRTECSMVQATDHQPTENTGLCPNPGHDERDETYCESDWEGQ